MEHVVGLNADVSDKREPNGLDLPSTAHLSGMLHATGLGGEAHQESEEVVIIYI